jgi:hypothetical protein
MRSSGARRPNCASIAKPVITHVDSAAFLTIAREGRAGHGRPVRIGRLAPGRADPGSYPTATGATPKNK